jgi:hypothetical protein
MLSVIMLSVIMLSVVMLSVIMLSVIMLSFVMLSVIMLSIISVLYHFVFHTNDMKDEKSNIAVPYFKPQWWNTKIYVETTFVRFRGFFAAKKNEEKTKKKRNKRGKPFFFADLPIESRFFGGKILVVLSRTNLS